jgi:hypothetical protein
VVLFFSLYITRRYKEKDKEKKEKEVWLLPKGNNSRLKKEKKGPPYGRALS